MSAIAERIVAAEKRYTEARDKLNECVSSIDEETITEDQIAERTDWTQKVALAEKSLESLREAEKRLAMTAEPTTPSLTTAAGGPRLPFATPKEKIRPQDYVWRSLTIRLLTHLDPERKPALEHLKANYGEDDNTKAVFDVVTKAATVPADTVTSGWASQLVSTAFGDFFEALMPNSLYPALKARGGSFTFGRNGTVTLPTRSATPTIAGAFVAQGAAIPVKQGAFTSVSFTPKKMGVISTFTREISEHSTPAIEAMIRRAIIEDTAVSIDTVLIDTNTATTTRPAGLLAGITTQTPAGTSFSNMVTDLRNLTSVLITGTRGNIRNPVWLMGPDVKLAISLKENAGGDFPFKAELTDGTLLGYPVITSTTMTADTIILLDAADFVTVTGDVPRFNVSDSAVVHMEDTTPLAISTVATPNTVAAPVRSLWQTDTIGIRMTLDINWGLLRTGTVALLTAPTWN